MKKLFPIIISVSMFFIILISSLLMSTYNKDFYISQFHKNNTYSNEMVIKRNINPEIIADEVIGYLKNDFDNLNKNNYYTNEEIIHMKDVKDLFSISKYILYVCIFLVIIISILYFSKHKSLYTLLNKCIKYFILIVITISLFLLVAFFNFSESFNTFHEILFTNDYWLLDMDTSIIINIMPEEFFMAHAQNIGKLFAVFSLSFILILKAISLMLKKSKN